jgi:hypothetical protein
MAFTDDLLDLFTREITINPWVSYDSGGVPSYGAAETHPVRVEMKDVGVRTVEGTTIIGRGRLWIPYTTSITIKDKLTLPAGLLCGGSANPPMLSVSTVDDETGGSYTAIILG